MTAIPLLLTRVMREKDKEGEKESSEKEQATMYDPISECFVYTHSGKATIQFHCYSFLKQDNTVFDSHNVPVQQQPCTSMNQSVDRCRCIRLSYY